MREGHDFKTGDLVQWLHRGVNADREACFVLAAGWIVCINPPTEWGQGEPEAVIDVYGYEPRAVVPLSKLTLLEI